MKDQVKSERVIEKDLRILKSAILRIPQLEKRVVFLHFWESWNVEEIALFLGFTLKQVERALARAFESLRSLCELHPGFRSATRDGGRTIPTENLKNQSLQHQGASI